MALSGSILMRKKVRLRIRNSVSSMRRILFSVYFKVYDISSSWIL
jgi:hypothetical protein